MPNLIIILSGKRKCGKDFIAEKLLKHFGEKCGLVRLSAPLKEQFAKDNNLDYSKLLNASQYKEKYRERMIAWGEEKRNQDPDYFCKLSVQHCLCKDIWIVSDARRTSDISHFQATYKASQTVLLRIDASNETRKQRGWEFVCGIDDAASECGLDQFNDWDFVINNDNNLSESVDEKILNIVNSLNRL